MADNRHRAAENGDSCRGRPGTTGVLGGMDVYGMMIS